MTTQLAFRDTKFNAVTINNQIWLTSKELAQALKYASTKSVTDIYNKNTDEFTAGMSQVVESTTSGNYRKKVRIFSLRGAHLIAMFARTEIAKEFRKWVLDILDWEVGNVQPVITPINPEEKTYTITLTEKELNHLCWLWKVADNMRKGAEVMYPGLKALGSEFSGRCYDMAFESRYTLRNVKETLRRETKEIEPTGLLWERIIPQIRQIH